MQLKDGEFECENYGIPMNRKDCLNCQGYKRCELKEKIKDEM